MSFNGSGFMKSAPSSDPLKGGHNNQKTDPDVVNDVVNDVSFANDADICTDYRDFLYWLWEANPEIYEILRDSAEPYSARQQIFDYLEAAEREMLEQATPVHSLVRANTLECIRVMKNIIAPVYEEKTGVSSLTVLWELVNGEPEKSDTDVSMGFIMEFIHLFLGVAGNADIYPKNSEGERVLPEFLRLKGRNAALSRMKLLDRLGQKVNSYFTRYPSGLDQEIVQRRQKNRKRILRYFDASEEDWNDYVWQIRHVIRDLKPLQDLIELTPEQKKAVNTAAKNQVPFGITPYYLSLMDPDITLGYDHAIRAQVIPPLDNVLQMVEHRCDRNSAFDFMGEHDTSPIDLVTRRYPCIAILKPYNTCAQICVYCQRNWEIEEVLAPGALASPECIRDALAWFDRHPQVGDVLVTGGDPCVMRNKVIKDILANLALKKHVYRIRLGTRTPVVLPMRFTDELIDILSEFHKPGTREIALVTHFEHPSEITPEAMEAVQKIRKAGIGVYNQEVFTIENSRRFETCKLRRDLRLIGVDPYYNFNMKGKGETKRFMVPIARILQERKEEARLLPGLDRTDEAVFNVPRLGKNHLRAWQDHKLVMIKPDGSRIYEFHPWEKNIALTPTYFYRDVPIHEYLEKLSARGEDVRDYQTIWYYY